MKIQGLVEVTIPSCFAEETAQHVIFDKIFEIIGVGPIDDMGLDWHTDGRGQTYIDNSKWFVSSDIDVAMLVDAANILLHGKALHNTKGDDKYTPVDECHCDCMDCGDDKCTFYPKQDDETKGETEGDTIMIHKIFKAHKDGKISLIERNWLMDNCLDSEALLAMLLNSFEHINTSNSEIERLIGQRKDLLSRLYSSR